MLAAKAILLMHVLRHILCGRPAVACSTTGVGERVMQALLARQCAERAAREAAEPLDEACANALQDSICQV